MSWVKSSSQTIDNLKNVWYVLKAKFFNFHGLKRKSSKDNYFLKHIGRVIVEQGKTFLDK